MPTYKTPDVYIEEISVFPPSVAEVETAIPAFIGYTEIAKKNAVNDLILKPTKIYSLKEYEQYYGYPKDDAIAITVTNDSASGFTVSAFTEPPIKYLMYYSVKMFFDNGGGQCYIIAVNTYQSSGAIDLGGIPATKGLKDGLDLLALEDEPTLIVIPEAVKLTSTDYQTLVQAVLLQCDKLRDRFAIFDIYDGGINLDSTQLNTNRGYFGNNYLKYGAAYYPFLKTTLNFYVNNNEANVSVTPPSGSGATATSAISAGGVITGIAVTSGGTAYTSAPTVVISGGGGTGATATATVSLAGVVTSIAVTSGGTGYTSTLTISFTGGGGGTGAAANATVSTGAITSITITSGGTGYTSAPTISFTGGGGGTGAAATATIAAGAITSIAVTSGGTGYTSTPTVVITAAATVAANLAAFQTSNTALYNFVKSALKDRFITLPPSGAIAGVYAATDSNRGVWKAPANVSLANVIEPVIKLDNTKQDDLNVDATTGKSINAIRAFMGKGTLVWGARTLAGNDNEWRYIPVRRFFSVVEESVKKSTYWAVFEPNDANTWVKVRGMIENYLTQKWREGALAGATPKEAFFVKCGLGITMTAIDILEGRMNVEIGMAVVRPAEFIILKFSHKLQTS